MEYPVVPCGDCAVTIQVGSIISEAVNQAVMILTESLRCAAIPGIMELVPSYTAVCLHYDPKILPYDVLMKTLKSMPQSDPEVLTARQKKIIRIPVRYGGEYGPDLNFVAEHCGLTPKEVVAKHSGGLYLVYMLGFLPGFAYLGGMDEAIACPRLTSPRAKIPAGSVGIAGGQTGIYPLDSPGGWQLIGRTALKMFSIENGQSKFALSPGDYVQFVPVFEDVWPE